MSGKMPVVSGRALIKFLESLGYETVRQKGSHIRLVKSSPEGRHNITVPNHKEVARGTLNDILGKVGMWNNMSKEDLMDRIRC